MAAVADTGTASEGIDPVTGDLSLANLLLNLTSDFDFDVSMLSPAAGRLHAAASRHIPHMHAQRSFVPADTSSAPLQDQKRLRRHELAQSLSLSRSSPGVAPPQPGRRNLPVALPANLQQFSHSRSGSAALQAPPIRTHHCRWLTWSSRPAGTKEKLHMLVALLQEPHLLLIN